MSTACCDVEGSPFDGAHEATTSRSHLSDMAHPQRGLVWKIQKNSAFGTGHILPRKTQDNGLCHEVLKTPKSDKKRGSHWCTSSKWWTTSMRLKWHAMLKVECKILSVTSVLPVILPSLANSLSAIMASVINTQLAKHAEKTWLQRSFKKLPPSPQQKKLGEEK